MNKHHHAGPGEGGGGGRAPVGVCEAYQTVYQTIFEGILAHFLDLALLVLSS